MYQHKESNCVSRWKVILTTLIILNKITILNWTTENPQLNWSQDQPQMFIVHKHDMNHDDHYDYQHADDEEK